MPVALALAVVFTSPSALAQSVNATPKLATTPAPATAPGPLQPPMLTQATLGLAVGGVGAIGFLIGAGLGITATIKKGESSAAGHCVGNLCDRTGAALLDASLDYGNWSTALFIAGGLVFAGGVVLVATAPVDSAAPNATRPLSPTPPAVRASAQVILGPGSLLLAGTW